MRLDPSSALGEWALVSLIGFATGVGMVIAAVAAGERAGETFTSNWWLAGPEMVAAVCAVATVLFGVLAIRMGDRAVAVIGATCFGLLVTLWVSMAIAFPH